MTGIVLIDLTPGAPTDSEIFDLVVKFAQLNRQESALIEIDRTPGIGTMAGPRMTIENTATGQRASVGYNQDSDMFWASGQGRRHPSIMVTQLWAAIDDLTS